MKPQHRYGLIALFFLAFFILAPVVVLFVTGTKYDFKTHHFIKTGTIAAKTDPGGASIYLNGKLSGTTSATLRFVLPGDYDISLKKSGYFEWDKRLNVRAQYVTYLNQDISAITLFYSNPQSSVLAQNVDDLFVGNHRIIYVSAGSVYAADISSPQSTQQLKLPAAQGKISIKASADENYFVLYNDSHYSVFDVRNNSLTDISPLVNSDSSAGGQTNAENFAFDSSGNLFFLGKSIIYAINWRSQSQSALSQNTAAFTVSGNSVYALVNQGSQKQLVQFSLADPNPNLLLGSLPNWSQAQIFLNNQHQIFILGDQSFYMVSGTLNRLADFIKYVQVYDKYGEVLFASNNEIDLYNYFTGQQYFVTRSSQQITNTVAFSDLGVVFFANAGRLQSIEIDNRDRQNNYTFATASDNSKFYLNSDGSEIFLLDNGFLKQIKIR